MKYVNVNEIAAKWNLSKEIMKLCMWKNSGVILDGKHGRFRRTP